MAGKSILPPPPVIPPTLDIGRAYSAGEAAAILGITPYVLNERVREGRLKPVFDSGDRRYSGYVLAQLLGWPLSPRDWGITPYVLNERVREGRLKPVFDSGDRRYSGYVLAQLLGWPLSDDPRDYLPGGGPVKTKVRARSRR